MIKCPFCLKEFTAKEARIRSTPENKYYWGVCVQILSDELGYHRNEIHEILKGMFLSEVKFLKTKEGIEEIRIPKSTAELTTIGFENYLSDIRQWSSAELGIWLPEPNEEINK